MSYKRKIVKEYKENNKKYRCEKCGFGFNNPITRIKHNGITTRHHNFCPRCNNEL